jgi:hypothetical protein
VVVLIARGMMDTKLVTWNTFHGARTGDVDAAARALRDGLTSLAIAHDRKRRQILAGVGYSMGEYMCVRGWMNPFYFLRILFSVFETCIICNLIITLNMYHKTIDANELLSPRCRSFYQRVMILGAIILSNYVARSGTHCGGSRFFTECIYVVVIPPSMSNPCTFCPCPLFYTQLSMPLCP